MIETGDVAFFVTGMGRSGTKWLADLLKHTPSRVRVMHEPLGPKDKNWYGRVYRNPALGPEWMWYRRRRMNTDHTRGLAWGEVNSYLRYAAHDLRVEFPGVPVAGLVRDGRFVVRSLMRMEIYDRRHPPVPMPTWAETPFLKCCHYWADTYRLLVAWGVPIYRLEDLNADYAEVEVLCEKLGIDPPPKNMWREKQHRPLNTTEPQMERLAWSRDKCEAFRRIAGDMQHRFGYPVFTLNSPTDPPPKTIEGAMGVSL